MLSRRLRSRKNNKTLTPTMRQAPSYVKDNDPISFLTRHQGQTMVLNEGDFRACFTEALTESDKKLEIADEWCLPNRLFTFQFDEPKTIGTVFEGISSNADLDENEERAEYWKGIKLQDWFKQHEVILERTLAIALQVLRARKSRDQALAEEPEDLAGDLFPF